MFNPFKSRNKYFLICKIGTVLFCLPWPLTMVATLMSLAGPFPSQPPMFERILIRLGWLLVLIYPVVFLALVFFAETVLAPKSYFLAAALAVIPILLGISAMVWLFGL